MLYFQTLQELRILSSVTIKVMKVMMMVVMRLFYRNESDAEGDGFDTCHMGSQLNPSLNFITTVIIIVGTIIIAHYLYSRSKIGEI